MIFDLSQVWNPLLYAMLNLQLRAAFIALMPEKLRHWLGERLSGRVEEMVEESLSDVSVDEKTTPLVNGPSEHPARNGSLKLGTA